MWNLVPAFGLLLILPAAGLAQWTAAAYIGKARTHDADIRVEKVPGTSILFRKVSFEDRSFRGPVYYGFRGGFLVTPGVGLEAEFIHLKAFAGINEPRAVRGTLAGETVNGSASPSIVLKQYGVSHGLNLLLGNFLYRLSLSPRMDLALRAGAGVAVPHPEIRVFDATLNEYQLHGAAFQAAAGIEVDIAGGLFWLAEYKFTHTKTRFELEGATVGNAFQTQHWISGVGLRF